MCKGEENVRRRAEIRGDEIISTFRQGQLRSRIIQKPQRGWFEFQWQTVIDKDGLTALESYHSKISKRLVWVPMTYCYRQRCFDSFGVVSFKNLKEVGCNDRQWYTMTDNHKSRQSGSFGTFLKDSEKWRVNGQNQNRILRKPPRGQFQRQAIYFYW